MSAVPAAVEVPLRLRVMVAAVDSAAANGLAARIREAGHEVVATADAADVILADAGAAAGSNAPGVVLGSAEGEFAGLLPADAAPAQLDAALRAVASGLVVRAPPPPRFGPLPDQRAPVLTPREIEVLTALAAGLSNKATARRLGISPHTVKFHIEQLFRKLGAGCRAEAVAKGLKQQIVEL